MITLYGGGPNFGLPEVSPSVTKTEIHLKMAGLAYEKKVARPQTGPKGQMPWIEEDGERIGDSVFIRLHIENKYGFDFDAGLDPLQRAQAWAVERMMENHLAQALGWSRWMIPENFDKGPARFFDHFPAAERDAILQRVAANFLALGISRHTPEEIADLGGRSLEAVSLILGDKTWLMGEQPCGADASVFAMVAGILTPWFDSPLRRRAEAFPNLVAYVERGMKAWYPEFEQRLAA